MEESAKRRRVCENDGTARGASSTHASTEGQEVAASLGHDYEVFLSFRGPDTRAGFADFLYTSLKDAGIRTFRDDEELHVGEEFAQELPQAIKQSKISIPIFSKGYASSPWCLKELVQMVECQENGRQKIMPIFYDVAPSEVRYQTGGYKKAFHSHENKKRYDEKTMQDWKDALNTVGAIHGWDLHNETNRREGEFAKEVTKEVFRELKKAYLEVSDCLVGVDTQVDEIMEMISAQTSEIRIIGIHGMGGIGKTTIAKIIYNQLSSNFEDCCFLSNIRETSKGKGVECLQKQLISNILRMKETDIDINNVDEGTRKIKERFSNKKVLLLLDDVETENHIDAFVGKHDWFGRGSRIIVTTRNINILHFPGVYCSYELKCMDPVQSLKLFSKHAFRRDSPLDEDMNQSNRAIDIAKGLPLALEVIGSLLCRTKKERWDLTLKKLENVPPAAIQSKLKISYDALEVRQQDIFLDIACLFIGYNKDIVVHFWDESKFPEQEMEVLQNMSLIKIEETNKVWMHDQLRDLGREIVRKKGKMKIEKQSRVWDPEEALDLLRRHEGKTKVEALCLHFDHEQQYCFTYKDFEKISNLRFLQVDDSKEYFRTEERLLWHESPSNVLPIDNFQENSYLLPQLRWLSWPKIPPTFKITNFSMKGVVILNLSESKITHDWKGWSHMKVMKNLKVMNLTRCVYLKRTPDFSAHSKLEHLILQGCHKLVEVDKSICQLKSLVFLDVTSCVKLRGLPDEMGIDLASLKYLYMSNCHSLERLPNTIKNLKSLNELNISRTGITELPDTLWKLEKLEVIEVGTGHHFDMEIGNGIYGNRSLRILKLYCWRIRVVSRLPESLTILELSAFYTDTLLDLSNLTNLKELRLQFGPRGRGSDGPLGENPMPLRTGNLSKLESLHLESPYATTIPIDMRSLLPQLKSLGLRSCPNLSCLPSLPSSLSKLYLESKCVTTLPMDMSSLLPRLQSLHLRCPNLRCLPSLPSSLSSLEFFNSKLCYSMVDLSNLKTLSTLYIVDCAVSEIRGLDRLENLQYLTLEELKQMKILPDLSNLNKLQTLNVFDCGNLVEIQGELPPSLEHLVIRTHGSLQKLPDLSSLKGLRVVEILGFGKLNVEDLSNLKTLSSLCICNCAILEIRGLDRLENLQDLYLSEIVEILPDLSNLNKLWTLQLFECGNLVEIQGELPPSLKELVITRCGSLQKLPDLSSLKGLREVKIEGCRKLNVEDLSNLKTLSSLSISDCAISEIRGLDHLENLRELSLWKLQHVEILPDLSNLNKLRALSVIICGNLVEIQGELPPSLEELFIGRCESLQKLPDLSSLKGLRKVTIKDCGKLNVEAISS